MGVCDNAQAAPALTLAPAAAAENLVTLACGRCGDRIGVAAFPPPPPFAALDFEARALLRPLLRWAARKAPARLSLAIIAYVNGGDVDARGFDPSAALAPMLQCLRCAGVE